MEFWLDSRLVFVLGILLIRFANGSSLRRVGNPKLLFEHANMPNFGNGHDTNVCQSNPGVGSCVDGQQLRIQFKVGQCTLKLTNKTNLNY